MSGGGENRMLRAHGKGAAMRRGLSSNNCRLRKEGVTHAGPDLKERIKEVRKQKRESAACLGCRRDKKELCGLGVMSRNGRGHVVEKNQ